MSESEVVDAPLPQLPHHPPSAAWLASSVAAALEPGLPIIDCHHDFFPDSWGGYLLADLLEDLQSGHSIRSTVYVQCGWHYRERGPDALRPIGESEAVVVLAKDAAVRPPHPEIAAAIVAYAELGGLGTTVFGFDFSTHPTPPSSQALTDAWRPLMEPVIELFGAQRCMFESNYPVDRGAAGYGVVWNAFKRLAAGATPEQKALLFHDTATRMYRL